VNLFSGEKLIYLFRLILISSLEPEGNQNQTDRVGALKKVYKGTYKESRLTSSQLHFLISLQRGIRIWKQRKK
jgi:hypothetical protein